MSISENRAKLLRAKALIKLKEGLTPLEIEDHLKEKGDPDAYDVSIAAEAEVGDKNAKLSRDQRRYWDRFFSS